MEGRLSEGVGEAPSTGQRMGAYCSSSARPSSDSLQITHLRSTAPYPLFNYPHVSVLRHFFNHKGAVCANCLWEVSETSFPRFLLLWKAGALVWSVFPLGEPNAPDRIILTFHLWSFDSELFSVMSRLPLTGSSCALSSSANWYQLILKIRVGRFKSISFLTPPVVQYFWIVVSRLMFTET